MSNRPTERDTVDDSSGAGAVPHEAAPPPAPGWVKVVAVIGVVLIATFIAIHLAGGGVGHHMRVGGTPR